MILLLLIPFREIMFEIKYNLIVKKLKDIKVDKCISTLTLIQSEDP
jgi:hypothetical protein